MTRSRVALPVVHRWLQEAEVVAAALDAALEALAGPAFVSDADGKVSYANNAARALLAERGTESRARICEAIVKGDEASVITLRGRSSPPGYLVVFKELGTSFDTHFRSAVNRWRLTAREADVLRGLVAGELGKVTAARLGVHPGSVERHVAAIFKKSGFRTRGRLLASFWRGTTAAETEGPPTPV